MSVFWQIAASVITLAAIWRVTSKSLDGPLIGIVAQFAWGVLIVHDHLWGLAPLTICMAFLYSRMLWTWWNNSNPERIV